MLDSLESRELLSTSVQIAIISPPANDNFSSATVLSGATAGVDGTLVGATAETDEPIPPSSTHSVWYTWKAPASAYVGIALFPKYPDVLFPELHLFTGDSMATLNEITGKSGGFLGTEFHAVAGQTYRIAVDDFDGEVGAFHMDIRSGLPRVSIKAADTTAAETRAGERPDTATFLFKRSGPTDHPLRIRYFAYTFDANAAKSGKDYQPLPGTIKIPAGKSSARMVIHPIDDRRVELTETIDLGLSSLHDSYVTLGSRALVEILDNEPHTRTAPRPAAMAPTSPTLFSKKLIAGDSVLGSSSDGNELCSGDLADGLAQSL